MLTVLAAIVLFGVLITVHELGHFLAAKATGMLVTEFSVGFDPLLYQRQVGETLYSLRIIPFGGYNRIAGMEPGEEDLPRGFGSRPLWARMITILAGPFMNFLLPVVIFFGMYALSGIDIPVDQPIVGSTMAGYPAEQAGVVPGDRIVSINGVKLTQWKEISEQVQASGPVPSKLVVERGGKVQNLTLKPQYESETNRYLIGITPKLNHKDLGLVQSASTAVKAVSRITVGMLQGIKLMVTRKVSAELSGPIGVAQMAGDVAAQGAIPYLGFMAFLSINLAVLNLLPIPALDGGQFLVLVVEGLRGKPLAPRAKGIIQMIGVGCILFLTIYATLHDLIH